MAVAAAAVACDDTSTPHPQPESVDGQVHSYISLQHPPGAIDPVEFFEQLVDRYRTISAYEDHTHVVEVTTPDGGDAQLRETDLQCEITSAGELHIRTPGETLLADFGVRLPFVSLRNVAKTKRDYDLWQAPHLGLRFMHDPLREFRVGAPDGFKAARARPVTIGTRELVQLKLEASAHTDTQTETQFDLFVDPQSMLVERIEGRERLPDGATYETTLQIELGDVRDSDGALISRAAEGDPLPAKSVDDPQPGWIEGPPMQTPDNDADSEAASEDTATDLPAAPPTGFIP